MREFTQADVNTLSDGSYPRIYADRADLISAPLPWQTARIQETRTGYGARLNSGLKIWFEGRAYRLYVTIYGNSGSTWFTVRGKKIYVD